MERNLQRIVPWCFIVFFSVFTLTESRLMNRQGLRAATFHNPYSSYSNIQPQLPADTRQHVAEVSVRPRPVVVKCHPDSMEVVVQADMFHTGLRVDGRYLRLGSDSVSDWSECRAVPSGEAEFTIHALLMNCGTKLSSTEEKIIYSNILVYSPEASSDGVLRLDEATVPVECHYDKKYSVDVISLQPTWVPFVSRTSADNRIYFSLLLMTDDWQFERGSYSYFLGDPIHFEVSAITGDHTPLRVYVDHCVASATPDAEATLKYDFIEHNGCLSDAYLTNSSSRFLPRVEEHKLRFQIYAFKFYQESSNQVYITCYVKAVPVTLAVSAQNRACSLIENRWWSVDGSDEVCGSCDVSRQVEELPSTELPKTMGTNTWPTVITPESFVHNRPEHHPATYVRFHPGWHQSRFTKPQHSGNLMKRGTDYTAEQTLQLGPLIVLPSSKFVTRSMDFKAVRSQNMTT